MELSCTYSAPYIIKGNNMQELIDNVIQWAADRNILEGSTVIKQLDKTSEEFNELQRAVALCLESDYHNARMYKEEVVDAYGDILVTLIISAKMLDIDLEDALAQAYEVIRHRKGKMISGRFVKEEDL